MCRWLTAILATSLAATAIAACGRGATASGGAGRPTVVATTTQLGDFAREVAGRRASVTQILQANSDPHQYEPRPSDIRAVTAAKVVLRSGGDVDAWLHGVLHNAGNSARVLTVIDAIRTRRLLGQVDPHWWQSPLNAEIAVEKIRDALIGMDPAGRDTYAANAAVYLRRLRGLDAAIHACLDAVPEQSRKLVTDHDALGYYADRYGIQVIGTIIPSLSTRAQASAGAVARLVRTSRTEKVTTIFSASSVNPKLARAIAHDAGAKVVSSLYADTLGPKGSTGDTYIGSLTANTRALVTGFTSGRTRCRL